MKVPNIKITKNVNMVKIMANKNKKKEKYEISMKKKDEY
jgi:hypothetical protein